MPLFKPTRAIQFDRSHPLARGLVGCWLFNEVTGSFFQDTGGRGHHFNIGNGSPEWSGSRYGGGVLLDGGSSEYLQCNTAILPGPPISVVAWAKCGNITSGNTIFDIGYSGSHTANLMLAMMGSYEGDPVVAYARWGGAANWASTTKSYLANTWHQCVAVFASDNDRRVYIDGANEGTNTGTRTVEVVDRTHIGAMADQSPGNYFSGIIDHVMVWNRVLTAAEIAWLYREPFAMFEHGSRPVSLFVPGVVELVGSAGAQSQIYGKLTSVCRIQELERLWLRNALFGGMTANAFKLGTVLTGGWFWTRVDGCTALYRGGSMEQIDFENILTIAEPDTSEIKPPVYIPHDNDSVYFYVVRRFNKCGLQERTLSAAAKVSIEPDGSLKEPQPNKVFAVTAQQIDGNKIKLVWFYNPLEQKSPPACFHVYYDNASGQIDFDNPLATIEYQGQKFYSYVSSELAAVEYLFAVRAESADGFDNESQAQIKIQLDFQNPEPINILETQTF